jgi:high-affinity iron transporter
MSLRANLRPALVAAALLALVVSRAAAEGGTSDHQTDTLRQVAGILDYIAGDYRGAVSPSSEIIDASELKEQRALAKDAVALVGQIGLPPSDRVNVKLAELNAALDARTAPSKVEALCRSAREAIVGGHGIDLAPSTLPSRTVAERLYRSQACNTCHGEDGGAHTPAAAALDPKPANFLDPARVATVSPHRAFHAITFGVPGTGMRSFAGLSEAERWSLAFYVLSLRHVGADLAAGQRALARVPGLPLDARSLSSLTEEELRARLPQLSAADSAAAVSYLRAAAPFTNAAAGGGFDRAYQELDAGLAAYRNGQPEEARRRFISAYLDGVEPHEAALRARDAELVGALEQAMLELRSASAQGVSLAQLMAAVEHARSLLDRAQAGRADANTALFGAMTIALREGVEIVLLVAALLGLVRKRGHPELARYVHAGWMLAVPAGLFTFYAAESLLGGMQRELAEGLASLLAALVLLGVTHWLIGQLGARHWVGFLARRISAAVSGRRAALGVLLLAFLAAYREAFEIVLFFQALVRDAGGAVREVWLGAAIGLLLLCVVAVLLLRVGQRLRPAPFMLVSSICLAVLSFALVGKGVHALQEAALVPATHFAWRGWPLLGVFPTVQGLLAQGVLLLLLLGSSIAPLRAARPGRAVAAPAE